MITQHLVVGDIVRRVPGTREQVNPSTNRGRRLRTVVGEAIVADPIAAAAARDHQTVVPVVVGEVLRHVAVARSDEDDAFPRRDAKRKRRPALRRVEIGRASCRERVYSSV